MEKLKNMNITQEENQEPRQYTAGESIVGITFNPSEDSRVKAIKEASANLIDVILNIDRNRGDGTSFQQEVFNTSIIKVLEAQMLAVKALFVK